MIDRHWDGIAAYCQPENKVSLGLAEGLNNKIRVIPRRAYGLRDQEYLCFEGAHMHAVCALTHPEITHSISFRAIALKMPERSLRSRN